MTTDLTKPVQTACGYPARVLATDIPGREYVAAAYEIRPGKWLTMTLGADGSHPTCPEYSLVNVPSPEPLMVTIRMTPEDAAVVAYNNHLFCEVSASSGAWTLAALRAHFTALAEQQRGEG